MDFSLNEIQQDIAKLAEQILRKGSAPERLTLMNPGTACLMYQQVLEHAQHTRSDDGRALIEHAWVQSALARCYAALLALQLGCRKQAWAMAQGTLGPAEASAIKVYGYECFLQCYRLMQEVLGPDGIIRRGYPGALLEGQLEIIYRAVPVYGFGGGANEVQRDLIAQFGLGLARARR